MRPIEHPQPAVAAPGACPFCRSSKIMTAGAKVDASTYWRCQTCGQMWNEARLRSSNPYGQQSRWK